MISRRDALKLGAAGLVGISSAGAVIPSIAQENGSGVWNWMGNAGHTGEFPGPGLDFEKPLGEKWRSSLASDSVLSGHVHDTLLITHRLDYGWFQPSWRIEARSALDGSLIWSRNAPGFESYSSGESRDSVPENPADGLPFHARVTAHGDSIILSLSNGHLWGVDATTGEDLWHIDSGHEAIHHPPTIVEDTALCLGVRGLSAIELNHTPRVLWNADLKDHNLRFLGVDGNLVWIGGNDNITALNIETGDEYWKTPKDVLGWRDQNPWYGISGGMGLFNSESTDLLTAVNATGAIAWNIDDTMYNDYQKVLVGSTISRFTPTSSNWDSCRIENLSIDDGSVQWSFDLATSRWRNTGSGYAVCDGIGYYALYDNHEQQVVLLAIDPIEETVRSLGGMNLIPEIVSGGVLYARDRLTDDLVCIGTVPGVLQPEGRAKVLQTTKLYGAPNSSSADKGQIEADTVLRITGNLEETRDEEWWPVNDAASGLSGWLQAEFLEGMDGNIVFQTRDLDEFGHFIS